MKIRQLKKQVKRVLAVNGPELAQAMQTIKMLRCDANGVSRLKRWKAKPHKQEVLKELRFMPRLHKRGISASVKRIKELLA